MEKHGSRITVVLADEGHLQLIQTLSEEYDKLLLLVLWLSGTGFESPVPYFLFP